MTGSRKTAATFLLFVATLVALLLLNGSCLAKERRGTDGTVEPVPPGAGTDWDVALTGTATERVDLWGPAQYSVELRATGENPSELESTASLDWLEGLSFANPPVKLYVDRRGLYRVEVSALLDSGFDWRGVPCSSVRLFCQGKQVPIWVDDRNGDGVLDADDAVEFWGEPYRPRENPQTPDLYYDNYTRVDAYWLVQSTAVPPKRLISLPGGITNLPSYRPRWFPWTEHFEKNRNFFRLGKVPYPVKRDHWFWGRITGGHLESFEFELPWPDTTTAMAVKVRACLHGRTYGDLGQHAARLVLGTQDVGQVLHWRDQNLLITEAGDGSPLYAGTLRPGRNEFSVLNLNPDEANEILFNWFELTYPRQYRAWDDELEFTVPEFAVGGRVRFRLDGFSTDAVDVYKIGVGKFAGLKREKVEEVTERGINEFWRIEFEDNVESASSRYVAVARARKSSPRAVAAASPPILWGGEAYVDYVVVAPDSFLASPAMDSLVELRRRDGLTVWKVSTESIYDNFNWGIYSPEAIRRFTRSLLRRWARPPRYLLLVGNSLRRRECFANPDVLVPSILVQTVKYGALPSDNQYVVTSETDVHPKIAVGRLPVGNLQELSLVVRKLWRYEFATDAFWRNRILMIAGMNQVFKHQTQTILENRWDRAFELHRLDARPSRTPFLGTSADLLSFWNEGAGLINFMGHGGGMVWADARMLTFDEVPQISNGDKLPFVTSMTCFTAAFEAGSHCLGNVLLLHPAGGAIAVLGSSGLGWIWNDYYLLNELVRALQDTTVRTLGEAVRIAKTRYYDRFGSSLATTMVNQYTFLGDPATPILLPRRKMEAQAVRDTTGRVTLRLGADVNLVRAQLLWPNFLLPLAEYSLDAGNGSPSFPIPEPAASEPESLAVRFIAKTGSGEDLAHGFVTVSTLGASIDSIWWLPAQPAEGDSVQFWLRTSGLGEGVAGQVSCTIPLQSVELVPTPQAGVWRSAERLAFLAPGDHAVTFVFRSPTGETMAAKILRFPVETRNRVNLRWSSVALEDRHRDTFVGLQLTNETARPETVVVTARWDLEGRKAWQTIDSDTLVLDPFEDRGLTFPWLPPFGDFRLAAEVADLRGDVLARMERRVTGPYLRVVRGQAANLPGSSDSLRVGDFMLEPFGEWTGTVRIAAVSTPPSVETQEGLSPVSASLLAVRAVDSSSPAFGVFPVVDDSVGGLVRVCRYDSASGVWVQLEPMQQHKGWFLLDQLSLVGSFWGEDTTGPVIRLFSEGRPLANGAAVSPGSSIELVASDPNGLSPVDRWLVEVDGEQLKPQQLRARTTTNQGHNAVVSISVPKAPGVHSLSVQIADALGNSAALLTYEFRVSGEQRLRFLGNFPNPFQEETVFVFRTEQSVRRFSLLIFSTSGQVVRELSPSEAEDPNLLAAGYHEIAWDGKDQHGRDVGYGVYFFKLSVLSGDRWLTHVGKIARVP